MTLTLLFSMEWTKISPQTNLLAQGRHLAKVHPVVLVLQVKNEAGFCTWPFAPTRLLQAGEQFLQFIISLLRVRELTREPVFTLPQWSATKKQYARGENRALNIPKSLFFKWKIIFHKTNKTELFISMNDQINTFTCTGYKALLHWSQCSS